MIPEMEYKRDNLPLRILGIKVTKSLELSVYTTIFGVIFGIGSNVLSNKI